MKLKEHAGEIYWCYVLRALSSVIDFLIVFVLWELVHKKKKSKTLLVLFSLCDLQLPEFFQSR